MNSEICIGKLYYKKIPFQLFFQTDVKKVVARLEVEHPEKAKLEKIVTDLIQIKDGGGYSKKRLSIKKLAIFAGMLACLGKPTMLVHASERAVVESELENQEVDTLDFNEDLIGKEIILYGKDEVDELFVNDSISKEGVLKILNRTEGLSDEVRGYVKDFIETVYEKEPNADMRIFAMNLLRNPQIYVNLNAKISYCSPGANRIWFHKIKKELIFHELSHFRTLTYGESYVKNDPKARIKVIGNSFVNSYKGSGMREAYCVALNHRIGMEDQDYGSLYMMERILNLLFPEQMHEIETYNDYEGLKKVFLQNGLTSNDYDVFIAATDTISKIHQDEDLQIDYSLLSNMMTPVITLVKNKCIMEGLDYQEYVAKINASLPESDWKEDIMSMFQFLNVSATVNQEGERIVLDTMEVGPAYDTTLKQEEATPNSGPAYDETLSQETENNLLFGEENIGPAFVEDVPPVSMEQPVSENAQEYGPAFDASLKQEEPQSIAPQEENFGPAFVNNTPNIPGDKCMNTPVNPQEYGPAFDESLKQNAAPEEIGPGVQTESMDDYLFDSPVNSEYQTNDMTSYEDFNQIFSEYFEDTNLRR